MRDLAAAGGIDRLYARQRLSQLEDELQSHIDEQSRARDLRLVIDNLEAFGQQVTSGLEQAGWDTRREVIRTLVKRVEIEPEQVKVVYRVDIDPFDRRPERGILQDCWRRETPAAREARNPNIEIRNKHE
jgi:site-specific DNA recombinase